MARAERRRGDATDEHQHQHLEWYCETCEALIEPEDLDEDGRCPQCGGEVREPTEDEAHPKAPWHFKVLVIGTVGYLIYRLIWFIFWLTGHAWNG